MLTVSENWRNAYPGAAVGVLAMQNVANPKRHAALKARKVELEKQLRNRFADQGKAALKALPTIQAYSAYYKLFKKTYHVLLQLESVALQGKSIPSVASLVEAMFMAEMEDLILTAGHDLDVVQPPLRLDVSNGTECFVRMNGQEQVLKAGDMFIADARGVISSVIYGPDQRTQIRAETQRVFFTSYAPAGIGEQAVRRHLENIQANVKLVASEASLISCEIYT
jgi:DNA/RNA-binding domain of Phe-tRNA-synthetase-like protein